MDLNLRIISNPDLCHPNDPIKENIGEIIEILEHYQNKVDPIRAAEEKEKRDAVRKAEQCKEELSCIYVTPPREKVKIDRCDHRSIVFVWILLFCLMGGIFDFNNYDLKCWEKCLFIVVFICEIVMIILLIIKSYVHYKYTRNER